MGKKVYIKTYGCQMNVYDSGRMLDILKPRGFEPVASADGADLVILNTCHIREKASEKVYSDIGRIRRAEKPAAGTPVIAVAGCVGQAEGAEIMRRAPSVELVFGPQTYHRLPDFLKTVERQRAAGKRARVFDGDFPVEEKFDQLPKIHQAAGASAFLTIQEGCDKFCTFCVVPYTRGAEFSRPVDAIESEAQELAAMGVCDITLLGQNVSGYHGAGEKGDAFGLGALIRRLAEIPGLERIRYTTSHPRDMDDDLIAVHTEVPQCMPYLHLPVQSGSDRILAEMNRGHSADQYRDFIGRLRSARPDIALSSDFIVGFPGESDDDFQATMQLVRDIGFSQAYSFKYSPRPGTPAAERKDQIPDSVRSERLAELQAELNRQQLEFNMAAVGRTMPVLLDRPGNRPGQLVGRSPYMQAVHVGFPGAGNMEEPTHPDIDAAARSPYSDRIGRLMMVEIMSAGPNSLEGRPADHFSETAA